MSYFSDNEVMGGIGIGDDQFDGSYMSEGLTDHSIYNYGKPLDPYSPIQNEPMGRDFNPNNFNSSNPRVRSNYKYNPLSTYDLDTDEIYSNHMRGNPSFYKDRDALYGNATPDPTRNSFNVEQDFMQDSVDYQAPGFKSTANRRYNKAGTLVGGNSRNTGSAGKTGNNANEHFCGMPGCTGGMGCPHAFGGGIFTRNFLIILIIVLAVIIAFLANQNRELTGTLKSIFIHQMHMGMPGGPGTPGTPGTT